MLVNAEIMAQNRNPSAILDYRISDFCAYDPLGCRFSITVPNLAQKCSSSPKLWPKIKIQDGGRPPSCICYIIIIGPPTKSIHWFTSACHFLSRVSILLLTRDIDIVILSVRPSVCPSVCQSVRDTLVLYENGLTYRHSFSTIR